MKLNKTLIATLAVGGLLALSPALPAQDTTNTPATTPSAGGPNGGGGRGRMMGPNLDQMAKDLTLTDDQKAKVKTILDGQRQKMTDLRGDTTLSREDRMAKMKTITDDTDTQMKALLTPDQYDKWQKMPKPGQRGRGNGGGNNGTPKAAAPATPPQQ